MGDNANNKHHIDELSPTQDLLETELKAAHARLQHVLAVSPAIIYANQASGDFACTFVSEISRRLWGTHSGDAR